MPGAIIKMNSRLAEIIKSKNNAIIEDSIGHRYEHSLEVQIPFIQSFLDDFDIVPICIQHLDYSTCKEMGIAIARAIKEYGEPVLIVASSDMTHYESQKSAEQKDRMAIDQIIKLDPKGLFDTVRKHSISMCGFIPATIMLIACKELGAKRAEMIKYMTSGDVNGDYDQVVGYAGVVVV
jgi:AmmeMemoRadiSam system protein B